MSKLNPVRILSFISNKTMFGPIRTSIGIAPKETKILPHSPLFLKFAEMLLTCELYFLPNQKNFVSVGKCKSIHSLCSQKKSIKICERNEVEYKDQSLCFYNICRLLAVGSLLIFKLNYEYITQINQNSH